MSILIYILASFYLGTHAYAQHVLHQAYWDSPADYFTRVIVPAALAVAIWLV